MHSNTLVFTWERGDFDLDTPFYDLLYILFVLASLVAAADDDALFDSTFIVLLGEFWLYMDW